MIAPGAPLGIHGVADRRHAVDPERLPAPERRGRLLQWPRAAVYGLPPATDDAIGVASLRVDGEPVAALLVGTIDHLQRLKQTLSLLGYQATCRTTAETALSAYLHWGPRLTSRLDGDHLLTIWDERVGRLLLVRGSTARHTLRYRSDASVVDFCGVPTAQACPDRFGTACVDGARAVEPGELAVFG